MTIENSRRVNEVARQIVDASSPDVQADIRKAQQSQRASWMTEATRSLQSRFGAARRGVEEGVSAGIGVDETIVYAVGTPVFLVKNNTIDVNSARTEAI